MVSREITRVRQASQEAQGKREKPSLESMRASLKQKQGTENPRDGDLGKVQRDRRSLADEEEAGLDKDAGGRDGLKFYGQEGHGSRDSAVSDSEGRRPKKKKNDDLEGDLDSCIVEE